MDSVFTALIRHAMNAGAY